MLGWPALSAFSPMPYVAAFIRQKGSPPSAQEAVPLAVCSFMGATICTLTRASNKNSNATLETDDGHESLIGAGALYCRNKFHVIAAILQAMLH